MCPIAYVRGHEGEALLQLRVGHGPGQEVRVVLADVALDGGVQLHQGHAQPRHLHQKDTVTTGRKSYQKVNRDNRGLN